MPGRRSGTAAPNRRRARRCARLARVARCEAGRDETRNPRTVGRRYDPRALTDVLVRAAGDIAGGAVRGSTRARDRGLRRAPRAGAGLALAREPVERGRRARLRARAGSGGQRGDGRVLRTRAARQVPEDEFVSASQLYARHALVLDDDGRRSWARRHGTRATSFSASQAARRGTWSTPRLWSGGLRTARSPRRSRSHAPRAATSGRQRSSRSRSRPHRSS